MKPGEVRAAFDENDRALLRDEAGEVVVRARVANVSRRAVDGSVELVVSSWPAVTRRSHTSWRASR